MDFDRLYEILPKFPAMWSMEDISAWLNFIGLANHSEKFSISYKIFKISFFLSFFSLKSLKIMSIFIFRNDCN